jgi:hypothetical protein
MIAVIRLAGFGPLEGALTSKRLVERCAEREYVGARVGVPALKLLRRHVLERSDDAAPSGDGHRHGLFGLGRQGLHFSEAEVQQFGAGLGEHDVARFEIAMNDAAPVRRIEGACDLDGEPQGFARGQRTTSYPDRECLALQVFHYQEADPRFVTDIVQYADVRMVQARDSAGLAFEALAKLWIAGQMAGGTLIATLRSSRVSRALYTSPIPPAPTGETIS